VVPFWTSFLIRTYAWMLILRSEGLVNTALTGAGLIERPLELLYTELAVMIGLVYGELPFMILPLYASLEKLDLSLLEASTDLGANRIATFFRVTVPMTMPGIVAGIVLVFIPSIGQFVVSDLLGGAKSILAGNLIQNQFAVARNKPFGSAVAFELTAVVLLLLLAYAFYTKRKGQEALL
jgi:spermidine/putrescine transport system permease protein